MDLSSAAEQRATAVAKLKRAASLPRMKDGRRPPMHVEAVSEGERSQGEDRDVRSRSGSRDEEDQREQRVAEPVEEMTNRSYSEPVETAEPSGMIVESEQLRNDDADAEEGERPLNGNPNPEDTVKPARKRRSRSRTRSRGSKDMKNRAAAKQSPHFSSTNHTNESSADEYYTSGPGDDPPPSPPLISPIPSHLAGFPASHFLRSPITPVAPLFYPGTTPSTPLPTLDDIQKGVGAGLFRSNSAGAARAIAMSKLTGEPIDLMSISSPSPGAKLMRNNTVAGGERMIARRKLLNMLGPRINNQTDGEQTSGGEEAPPPPITAAKKRRRRSRRSSSRASTVVDDREDREPPSTSPNTPLVPPSPLPPGNVPYNFETPLGHRGVVIEDEDDFPEGTSPIRPPNLPTTPARNHRAIGGPRLPHTSDAPSNASTDSAPPGAVTVPLFISSNPSFRHEMFPASPFQTPIREPVFPDEEEVPYQDHRSRSRLATAPAFERDSEISWIADLVTERPVVDDEDDEDEDEEEEPLAPGPEEDADEPYTDGVGHRSSQEFSPDAERPSAPKPLIVDVETSPETMPAHVPPSPASPLALSIPPEQVPDAPPSPPTYPMRLSVARSPSAAADYTDWDDARAESTPKRPGESISTWEKMKGAFSRTGSSSGRRSRTNSLSARERRYNTDSSVSRESGASLNNVKLDKNESPAAGVFATQQAQPPIEQSISASPSILSLPPQSAPPGGMSPVPQASSADLLRYADSKLFPFPALKQLEEQRRARGITPSSSSPDVTSPINGFPFPLESVPSTASSSGATTRVAETGRERKLSHQNSDSRLWTKFSQPLASAPSSSSHPDYFSTLPPVISPTTSTSGSVGKLPTNRDGVRKWLSIFKSQPTTPTTPLGPSLADSRPRIGKKPSLSDLLMQRKDSELTAQSWDSDKSRTPTNVTSTQRLGTPKEFSQQRVLDASPELHARGDADMNVLASGAASPAYVLSDYSSPGFPSPPDPPSSTTPDPQSSLDDFPTRSTSESFSSTMSSSHHSPDPAPSEPSVGAIIMERLDEMLGRGSKSSFWPSAIDDPPRKLVLSSPVLQVANANTVKDRFLFLFNDILIIAKPILQDMDALLEATKPSPLDRKYIVKSVVQLRELRFSGDRDDTRAKTSATSNPMRHPVMRNFVHQFSKEPDSAVLALLGKSSARDDVALGQLLFRAIDLDRARLGEYLARRSSKVALKAFVDSFGLTGLRIDKALRVFLQALHVPSRATAGHSSALEYLLDSFASRWYEANAAMVAYDKDVAVKLTRAIVQLNEVMHGGIAQEPGITGYPKRNVVARDFVDAFRRSDPRGLVSEELLEKIYSSIRREKLFQARTSSGQPDIAITIRRPIPPRLTYRVQSEPIILRIPQPDPQLTIQLFGQDLVFDPPVLTFSKLAEVSFRVTGTALGIKTIIMWRSGPNALAYSGLPLSSLVTVERSFMRNTFQVAFLNHTGLKRRYMFSVDDPLIRHQWTVSLKRQIDFASVPPVAAGPSTSPAAEALALKVLQDTLTSGDDGSSSSASHAVPLSPVDQAYARLNGGVLGRIGSRRLGVPAAHVRSKSRSQLYRHNGAGKLELELEPEDEDGSERERALESSPSSRPEGRLWSGHELEVFCRQNSSIPAVLAYLQVGVGVGGLENGHANGNGAAS
ncbi:hypothetical protein C8Q80DRAFT_1180359 [Daedaleopsis nitida]|nr:hypothetical protein C8Q80DRAFT_1180359 [Daedaleopsis nitida]